MDISIIFMLSNMSTWFVKKKKQAAPPSAQPKQKPSLSLAKQRRWNKHQKGVPKPKPQQKADDREVETVLFVPHTAKEIAFKIQLDLLSSYFFTYVYGINKFTLTL